MRVPFLDRLKDATRRDFENFYKEQPYQHARYAQSQLLTLEKWVSQTPVWPTISARSGFPPFGFYGPTVHGRIPPPLVVTDGIYM